MCFNCICHSTCMFLYAGVRGEVASYQFNNYEGPILIQDVNCTGFERLPIECNVSTELTSECQNSSSIVRINCFFNGECMLMSTHEGPNSLLFCDLVQVPSRPCSFYHLMDESRMLQYQLPLSGM